jgi:hypothetical protein
MRLQYNDQTASIICTLCYEYDMNRHNALQRVSVNAMKRSRREFSQSLFLPFMHHALCLSSASRHEIPWYFERPPYATPIMQKQSASLSVMATYMVGHEYLNRCGMAWYSHRAAIMLQDSP